MIRRSFLIVFVIVSMVFSSQLAVFAQNTTEQLKAEAFLRTVQLAEETIKELSNMTNITESVSFDNLDTTIQAKIEDMAESQMAASDRPFEPQCLKGAKVQLLPKPSGEISLEVNRSDGEKQIWIKASTVNASEQRTSESSGPICPVK